MRDYPPTHFRGANLELLANFVRAWLHAAECDTVIAAHGLLLGARANPAVAMRAAAWVEMRAIATKLRLALSSTTRAETKAARPDPNAALKKPWEM